jgi:serine/threonine-protein kinase RsbT
METVREVAGKALGEVLPPRAASSILATLPLAALQPLGALDVVDLQELVQQLGAGIRTFGGAVTPTSLRELRRRISGGRVAPPHEERVPVRSDADVLVVQTRSQVLCRGFFGATDCVRLATAASELARNIYLYAREGEFSLLLSEDPSGVRLTLTARDQGPGIADLERILAGKYVSRTGLGRGLVGTQALLDGLEIDTAPGRGTVVRGWKKARLP